MKTRAKIAPKKVFVGMSGGVDSSVSAALLKKAGHDVIGVFIKVWQPDWIECNWKDERLEAMRAAAHLDIPFVTLDLEKEYKQGVIDYMIEEYRNGRTPNPDVMCNREVKFGAFLNWARKNGADYVATGHYARNVEKDGAFSLLAGKDTNKDQSYFLWTLTQDDLKNILFPVGDMEKSEVRRLARKFGLPNAEKKDSQGLCFIGKVDLKDFLRHYIETKPGDVLNEKGEVIGSHPGSLFFTIGERHGFQITKKTPNDGAYYVISKDADKNTLTVSERVKSEAAFLKESALITNTNCINSGLKVNEQVQIRLRYRSPLEKALIKSIDQGKTQISFMQSLSAVTPGQSLVIYKGEECLGGGIIV